MRTNYWGGNYNEYGRVLQEFPKVFSEWPSSVQRSYMESPPLLGGGGVGVPDPVPSHALDP